MDKSIPRGLQIVALIFLRGFYTAIQLLMAMLATWAIISAYNWAFSVNPSLFYGAENLLRQFRDFGFTSSTMIFVVCFAAIKIFQWTSDREQNVRQDKLELDQTADIKSVYGNSAFSEPKGIGYVTKVTINGKEFEGGHQMLAVANRHHKVNTASAFVRFKIPDTKLEMRIAQKSFWITPKKEPLYLGLTHENEPIEVLSHRYDCTFSDRNAVKAFLADEEVRRLLLPKHPNSYERSTLTVKNGEVRLECSADTKSDRHVAEVATFELMKKLLNRAEIFDRRLTEIVKVNI